MQNSLNHDFTQPHISQQIYSFTHDTAWSGTAQYLSDECQLWQQEVSDIRRRITVIPMDQFMQWRTEGGGGSGVRTPSISNPQFLAAVTITVIMTQTFPYILQESKTAQFGLNFRPQSPLSSRSFETERRICNLKQIQGGAPIQLSALLLGFIYPYMSYPNLQYSFVHSVALTHEKIWPRKKGAGKIC